MAMALRPGQWMGGALAVDHTCSWHSVLTDQPCGQCATRPHAKGVPGRRARLLNHAYITPPAGQSANGCKHPCSHTLRATCKAPTKHAHA